MGLSNGSSRARNYGQTINRSQGGGNKKAGLPFQIGRTTWDSVFMRSEKQSLARLQITKNPNVRASRPMGSTINAPYWNNGAHY
jgi:hypothetical protein